MAGRLHDVGKASDTFQSYLLGDCVSGGDHSTAGALIAHERYGAHAGGFLARIIISHHSGLSDGEEFARRMVKTLDWLADVMRLFSSTFPLFPISLRAVRSIVRAQGVCRPVCPADGLLVPC